MNMFLLRTTLLFCCIFLIGQLSIAQKCECVPYHYCDNGTTNTNEEIVIDIRMKPSGCNYLETCCEKANIIKIPGTNQRLLPPENSGCGSRNSDGVVFRITGDDDNEAQFGEFPWMVAIFRKSIKAADFEFKCGGSLIHPQVVLTAAHCIINGEKIKVRAGEWDTSTTDERAPFQEKIAKSAVLHKKFHKTKLQNDIALLFLESPFIVSKHINVVCLPSQNYADLSEECVVNGWGKDKFEKDGVYQNILKKVELRLVEHQQCQNAFRKTRLGSIFKLHESFICAGGEEGKDACTGDGGGPLVCPIEGQENKYQEVGIVAWGVDCGTKGVPGAYVNVAYFRKWIDQRMKERNFSITYDFNN